MGRTGTFFRGSELPRLWALLGILALGIPFVILWRPRGEDPAPPPPARAGEQEAPAPRPSRTFKAVQDKARMAEEDSPALAELLAWAREASPEDWKAQARTDVLYTHLWDQPARYRGAVIRLDGTALRSLTYDVGSDVSPRGKLYEVWLTTPESHKFPYAVVLEDLPKGFPIGPDISERVRVEGYFLKLLGYQAGDVPRAAPLLVGRLTWIRSPGSASSQFLNSPSAWTLAPLGLLAIYVAYRLVTSISRLRSGARPARRGRRTEDVPPEQVSTFLEELASPEGTPGRDDDGPGSPRPPEEAGSPPSPDWPR
jgi:hypothetical protein